MPSTMGVMLSSRLRVTRKAPGYGGYFYGNINVTGTVFGGSKDFKIDHPLDPANKYLFHSSVESSEMMNIYTGNVTTDGEGLATVQLPDWFEVLNTDFRYQLTVVGQFAQAIVSSKVASHRFGIRTDKPNVEVSWQITGIRQDAYAKAHPLVVEQEKDVRERGHYIYPELYGAPEEQSIAWARHPAMMKKIQEMKARQLAGAQGQTPTDRAETLPLAVPPTPNVMEPRALPCLNQLRPGLLQVQRRQSDLHCNRCLRNPGDGCRQMTICAETEGAIAAKPWFPQTTIHKDGARNGNWIDVQGG